MPRIARGAKAASSDAELLASIAEGDLSALGEVYDRYQADVRRVVARTLASDADVDDVVHATFLKLPSIAAGYDGRERARAWMIGVAVRVALRHRRSLARLLRVWEAFGAEQADARAASPESAAMGRQELAAFERAFARLAAKKRAAFVMIEIEGLTAEEAGRSLGVPAATVRTRLHHAREELREAMKRGGAW